MDRRAENNCPTAHKAPNPAPYYAVIFSSTLADDAEGYSAMAERMVELAREQEGFIDVESAARTSEGFGITVSYWRDLESIRKWKASRNTPPRRGWAATRSTEAISCGSRASRGTTASTGTSKYEHY